MFRKTLVLTVLAALSLMPAASAKDYDIPHRINSAARAVERMIESNDAEGMAASLLNSRGVAIFPKVGKAGFIVGGRYGEGLMLTRDKKGNWYGPTFYSVGGGSVGLQIGVSSTALMLTVNNEEGLKAFRGGTFTIGADVAAAAGPGGRSASVGTNINADAPIYTYSITKGAFVGVALDGSLISELPNVNRAYWGKGMTPAEALKQRAASKEIRPLIDALNRLIRVAKYPK